MKRDKPMDATGGPSRPARRDKPQGWRAAGPAGPAPRPARAAEPPHKAATPSFRGSSADISVLYGFHAVREALRAGKRKMFDIYATEAAAQKLAPEIAAAGLTARLVAAEDLSRRLGPAAVHQGVMLEARPFEALDISDIAPESGVVLVLDQITDPHNVGAIARTAAAFRVDALVMTERHAPELTGVLAKAASGGLEHVPIIHVVNLARALRALKDQGYLRVGLDSEGESTLTDAPLSRPLALILGGEGKGLRRLTRENCDLVARLDMPGPIKSLNVSNACAVALALVALRLGA
ncbi:RNA methyltransferase, TrmH family, group 3 [Methylocella silvestris BL2]|uniref:RNA methyltransferase, TrmH family, group 3 n=1 Tax=Methylocella silvestris (strain DSM 15510 / CIP 108128 / LMG 27833 / NCIMB 13906 / BL2) TaxID=395965 RepID=B8EQR7_METSB|nr:23S rRNA (guanosine(2251)-2'-O)-methyltransferase RlmB [Methylocella silvestris]ACK49338.1 RNA methyltransferase, TrmH family, group 3 [Methylocella silvestris BL2]